MKQSIDVSQLKKIIKSVSRAKPFPDSDSQVSLFKATGCRIYKEEVDVQADASPVAYGSQGTRYEIFWGNYEALELFITNELQVQYGSYDLTATAVRISRREACQIECRCAIRLPRLFTPKSAAQTCIGDYQQKESLQKATLMLAWARLEI